MSKEMKSEDGKVQLVVVEGSDREEIKGLGRRGGRTEPKEEPRCAEGVTAKRRRREKKRPDTAREARRFNLDASGIPWRAAFITFFAVALLCLGVGAVLMPPAPAAAENIALEEIPAEEEVAEEPAPRPRSVPRVSGGGGRSRGGSRSRDDIADIFCRQGANESRAEWQRRVPSYCIP
jgi:hypothetical protein